MIATLSKNWWLFLLRGIVAILLAILAFVSPGSMLIGIVLAVGFYAFVAGCLALAAAVTGMAGDRWWAALLEGLVGIVAALVIWFEPVTSTVAFVYVLAFWLILTGILQIAAGIQLRDLIRNEWLYVISGIISIVFGIWVVHSPGQGAVAEAWIIGWYALLFGIAQAAFGFRLRSLQSAAKTSG